MVAKRSVALLLVVSIALVSAFTVFGLLTTSRTIGSSGTVEAINVEVYWDSQCTQAVSEVDWGLHEPGTSVDKTIYVKNTGTAPMTLGLSYSGWVPAEAGNYISLAWDVEGAQVDSGGVVQAVLTLSVSGAISGITDFSFNIIIEGTG